MNDATFQRQLSEFAEQSRQFNRTLPSLHPDYKILTDDTPTTHIDGYGYIMHCAWAARILAQTRPESHIDFGSWIHFIAQSSAFIPNFTFADIRPARLPLPNLNCIKLDLVKINLPTESQSSVSCLHVLEHVGLGRYGDPIDANGDLKAASELMRIIKSGGQLLFVAPLNNRPDIWFNAHRNYSYQQVIDMFKDLKLKEFTIVNGNGLIKASPDQVTIEKRQDTTGCFWFIK